MATAISTSRGVWNGPLEIFFAAGHGRCLSMASSVLGRRLPAVLDCGLWNALAAPTASRPAALVTDIGNDLLFGQPVERIAAAAAECVDRLLEAGCRVTVTGLPVCNLPRLSPLRFRFFKQLLFPSSSLTFAAAHEGARRLDERLQELAKQRQIPLISPQLEWYGIDPIHVRRRHWQAACDAFWAPWQGDSARRIAARQSFARELQLRLLRPAQRRLWGVEQSATQPAARWADGTTIALY
jgi:hypothetical protein